MRYQKGMVMFCCILGLLHLELVCSFTNWIKPSFTVYSRVESRDYESSTGRFSGSETLLFAKKKKGKAPVAANLDFDLFEDDEPMSKKDQMKAQKKAAKEAKKVAKETETEQTSTSSFKNAKDAALSALDALEEDEPLSAKERKQLEKQKAKEEKAASKMKDTGDNVPGKKNRQAAALKALEEMERMEQMAMENSGEEEKPKLSKKEAKEAAKKAAKEAKKKAAKEAKKKAKQEATVNVEGGIADAVDGVETVSHEVSFHKFRLCSTVIQANLKHI